MKTSLVRSIAVSVCLLLAGWGCAGPQGREHTFVLTSPATVLSEALAVEKAQEALKKDGHSPDEWKLTRADNPPSSDQNGVEDIYFVRFSFRPDAGRIHFTNGKKVITYNVQLKDGKIVSNRFRGL